MAMKQYLADAGVYSDAAYNTTVKPTAIAVLTIATFLACFHSTASGASNDVTAINTAAREYPPHINPMKPNAAPAATAMRASSLRRASLYNINPAIRKGTAIPVFSTKPAKVLALDAGSTARSSAEIMPASSP